MNIKLPASRLSCAIKKKKKKKKKKKSVLKTFLSHMSALIKTCLEELSALI